MYLARQTGPDHPVAAPLAGPQVLLLGEGRGPAYLKAVLGRGIELPLIVSRVALTMTRIRWHGNLSVAFVPT